jgi:hypothetical protein
MSFVDDFKSVVVHTFVIQVFPIGVAAVSPCRYLSLWPLEVLCSRSFGYLWRVSANVF